MAIKKSIQNEYGADFVYHKISEVRIINNGGDIQVRMVVESYLDEESRRSGKAATRTENIIQHADFAMTPFYALLKAKFPQYQDAEDLMNDEETDRQTAVMTRQTESGKLLDQWVEPGETEEGDTDD